MYFYYFMRWCLSICFFFFFNDTATTEIYTLSLHDALPIWLCSLRRRSATVGWLWLLLLGFIFERDGWVSASDRETEHWVGTWACSPQLRSEERRVGKECRSRWSPYH